MTNDVFPELKALANRLLADPLPTAVPASAPAVYGYVRSSRPNAAYVVACQDLLGWWCLRHGWQLGAVFRDNGVASKALVRPGLSGLLDASWLPQVSHALVIDSSHLSGNTVIAKRLTSAIRRTGSTVRILADELREDEA